VYEELKQRFPGHKQQFLGALSPEFSWRDYLAAALGRQHHEEFEAQLQEGERQRQEIERLRAALNAKK
jgi:hypothetical protein